MSLKILLFAVYLTICVKTGSASFMGNETFLRQNIVDIIAGNFSFSDRLPYSKDESSDYTPKNHSEYDFIVIGAGSAGATIASRLSEIENVTVLLIEAGGKEYSIIDIPAIAFSLESSKQVNWQYKTERSDSYCLGMENQQCNWARGKFMGGSSSLNLMIATRGNRRDYDEWANITGDKLWSYKHFLKYFKKLESFRVDNITFDKELHNKHGPVRLTLPQRIPLTDAFIQAATEFGYPEVDYNAYEQRGSSYYQSTIYGGERWSTNRAYIRPAKHRKNLFVTQHSHVHKILIESKKAYGVRYSKNGKIFEVKAKKEIILSAGAVNSPQILMLSGVGPEEHLTDLKIKVIKDAPVGKNLQDHIACGGLVFKVNSSAGLDTSDPTDPKSPAVSDYINSKSGPFASGFSVGGLSFVNVDNSSELYPNIELILLNKPGVKDSVLAPLFGINKTAQEKMNADVFNNSGWSIWPMLLRPKSRGEILLRSINPFDKPVIRPNYMADPEDVRILIKSIRLTLDLIKTKPLQKIGTELYDVPSSCLESHKKNSDEYWECILRTYTINVYHYSGTCKMGPKNSTSSVVDPKLRVIGIKNLRVADASIMPIVISGHTNIPTIAIGEKAADMIKKAHKLL